MRLSWNEIRARASKFAREQADARYEKSETQTFYNEFFDIFDIKRRSVARYEKHVEKLDNSDGYIDLFWPKVLLVEQKTTDRSLTRAREQAFEYFDALPVHERPRYLLLCDFQTWELVDLDRDEEVRFHLAQLPEFIEHFGFMMGVHKRTFRDQDPVNIQASELIGAVHDGLKESGYFGDDLDRFLVRLVFCLFADDTGIFEPESFLSLLEDRTTADGADTGMWLDHLFTALNTPEDQRSRNLDDDFRAFPYVDGDLFSDRIRTADFDLGLREALIAAARFDWSQISPAIFGALFQSVMDPDHRRAIGAHYTTEQNILKVIEPLFLDDLRAEFERIKVLRGRSRRSRLADFQQQLGRLTFLDPACGCGNFLIIAYRELRQLEIDVLLEIHGDERQAVQDVSALSVMNVDQFYGIEIQEFPTRIAETALWMMDHIMNVRLSDAFGQYFSRIPLRRSPHIHCLDAHEVDWNEILPAERCSYVFGNPPFRGSQFQSVLQSEQVRRASAYVDGSGTLDYVAAWFLVASEYIQQGSAKIGFVATNSITQGAQIGVLWPLLYDRNNVEIVFAHRTFEWGSEASGTAHVHVVIIGLTTAAAAPAVKQLYSYDTVKSEEPRASSHAAISPYLIDAEAIANPRIVVRSHRSPINSLPRLKTGVQMIDNGILTFTTEQRAEFLREEPNAEPYFQQYLGGDEFINGFHRWVLYLRDAPPNELRALPMIRERLEQVQRYREASNRASTRKLAPTLIGVDQRLERDYLVLPNTSSERRDYVPIGWLPPDVIANQKLRILPDPELWHFGLLTSAMHMAWMRTVSGRMKSDYMYSVGVVYNTFPVPTIRPLQQRRLSELAQQVLDARAHWRAATLADLYDPDTMPANLRDAHAALDRFVDRIYRPRVGFSSERERVEHLLARYEEMVAPLDAAAAPKRGRRRRGA